LLFLHTSTNNKVCKVFDDVANKSYDHNQWNEYIQYCYAKHEIDNVCIQSIVYNVNVY